MTATNAHGDWGEKKTSDRLGEREEGQSETQNNEADTVSDKASTETWQGVFFLFWKNRLHSEKVPEETKKKRCRASAQRALYNKYQSDCSSFRPDPVFNVNLKRVIKRSKMYRSQLRLCHSVRRQALPCECDLEDLVSGDERGESGQTLFSWAAHTHQQGVTPRRPDDPGNLHKQTTVYTQNSDKRSEKKREIC